MKKNMLKLYFDRIAIAMSGTCVIHCVALPIVAISIPFLESVIFILLFILPFSVVALVVGYRRHKRLLPILGSGAGVLILALTAIFAEPLIDAGVMPEAGEILLTVIGGGIHAFGHVMNYRKTRFHLAQAQA